MLLEQWDIKEVKRLLHLNIDINYADGFGYTALIYASINGDIEIVRMLLKVPDIDVNRVIIYVVQL